jgi:hypothetical protein
LQNGHKPIVDRACLIAVCVVLPPADTHFFLDPANHKHSKPPDIISNHAFFNSGASSFFTGVDQFMPAVHDLVAERDAKAPHTELVLNEFIPVVHVRSCGWWW